MCANPLTNTSVISGLLGAGSQVFSYNDSVYTQSYSFNFGTGYWSYSETGGLYNGDCQFYETEYNFSMMRGWNLLPNPHYATYQMDDLRFFYNGRNYTYIEALVYDIIYNSAYTYEEHFVQTNTVRPLQSFFLYSFVDNLTVYFLPFNQPDKSLVLEDFQSLIFVTAEQEGQDKDAVTVAIAPIGTDNFDKYYDSPAPPLRPENNQLDIYISGNSENRDFLRLLRDCRGLLSEEEEDSHIFDFVIDLSALTTVTLRAETVILPEGYHLSVLVNEELINITDGDYYSFEPESLQLTGQFVLSNQYVYVSDDSQTAEFSDSFINYPNPFNPGGGGQCRNSVTTFSFSLPEAGNAELCIYNLKGQKVTTIFKGQLDKGPHQLVWNGTDSNGKITSSGVYFSRLQSAGKDRVRKLLILK